MQALKNEQEFKNTYNQMKFGNADTLPPPPPTKAIDTSTGLYLSLKIQLGKHLMNLLTSKVSGATSHALSVAEDLIEENYPLDTLSGTTIAAAQLLNDTCEQLGIATKEHDGNLDDPDLNNEHHYKVHLTDDNHMWLEGDRSNMADMEDTVILSPAQALSLLSWLANKGAHLQRIRNAELIRHFTEIDHTKKNTKNTE